MMGGRWVEVKFELSRGEVGTKIEQMQTRGREIDFCVDEILECFQRKTSKAKLSELLKSITNP